MIVYGLPVAVMRASYVTSFGYNGFEDHRAALLQVPPTGLSQLAMVCAREEAHVASDIKTACASIPRRVFLKRVGETGVPTLCQDGKVVICWWQPIICSYWMVRALHDLVRLAKLQILRTQSRHACPSQHPRAG